MEGGKHPNAEKVRRRRARTSNTFSFSPGDFFGHVLPFHNALPEERKVSVDSAESQDKDSPATEQESLIEKKRNTKDSPRTIGSPTKAGSSSSHSPKVARGVQASPRWQAKKDDEMEEDEEEMETTRKRSQFGKREWMKFGFISISVALAVMGIVMFMTDLDVKTKKADLEAILVLLGGIIGGYWWVKPVLGVFELFFQSTAIFSARSLIVYFSISLHSQIRQMLYVCLVFGLWLGLFDETDIYETVNRILGCAVIFVGARIVNRMFIKWFSLSFHQRTYFQKIYKAVRNEFLLVSMQAGRTGMEKILLSGHVHPLHPMFCFKRSKSSLRENAVVAEIYQIGELELYNSPFYVQKAAKHIRKNKLPVLPMGKEIEQTEVMEMKSTMQAIQVAKRVFRSLRAHRQATSLTLADLLDVLEEREASIVLDWDKKTEFEEITLDCLIEGFVNIYEERRSLALTLRDSNTVLGKVAIFTGAILGVVVVIIWLLIFEVDVLELWIAVGSSILGLSFIFGSSIQMIFETSMFIFFVHPFDVEDDIQLNGEQFTVESIGLHTTRLCHADGRKTFVRMSKLATSDLVNLSRSECKWEVYYIQLDAATPSAVFQKLTERVQKVMESDRADFKAFSISFSDICTPLKVSLKLAVGYNHSGADLARMNWDRTRILAAVREILGMYDVQYTLGMQPIRGLENLLAGSSGNSLGEDFNPNMGRSTSGY